MKGKLTVIQDTVTSHAEHARACRASSTACPLRQTHELPLWETASAATDGRMSKNKDTTLAARAAIFDRGDSVMHIRVNILFHV